MRERAPSIESRPAGQRRALIGIATSQLLVLTLWFSAAAVAPQLRVEWDLSIAAASWLTLAVQIGFVVGAFTIAASGIADSVPARRLFVAAAIVAATANAAVFFVSADTVHLAYGLRFVTGVALAGVYPSGMKAMAGWFSRGRGMALGVLVGDGNRETPLQRGHVLVDRGRVGKLRKCQQLDTAERLIPRHGLLDHLQHAVDPGLDLLSVRRTREIGLAGGGPVARRGGIEHDGCPF